MNDKIFIFIPTWIRKEEKEGASWQVRLKIARKALNSLFDCLPLLPVNVSVVVSDDASYLPAFKSLSSLVKERFPEVEIIRWKRSIGYERQEELCMRLALLKNADFLCYSEQDYLYTPLAFEKALDAFYTLPELNLLSLYDHPGKYTKKVKDDFLINEKITTHPCFSSEATVWHKVCCCSSTSMWRVSYIKENWSWFQDLINKGTFRDHSRSFKYYSEGGLILEPVESLLQHMRIDHSQDSPTFKQSYEIIRKKKYRWRKLMKKLFIGKKKISVWERIVRKVYNEIIMGRGK